jgi:hypothetical protein
MKRIILALVVGSALFAAAYAAAASLGVTTSTAATGTGDVVSCGDVTGTTFILKGEAINDAAGWTTVTGNSNDPRYAEAVNIETGTSSSCDQQDVFVMVDGAGSIGCTVHAGGGVNYNEADYGDNNYGCTALLTSYVDVAGITKLTVTMR